MTEQEISAHGKPGHDVTVTMMGAVADGPRAANDSGSHVTGLSTTLMGGVNGTLLRLGTYAAGNVDLPAWQAAVLEEYLPDFASTPAIEYFHQRSDWFSFGELPDPSAGTDSWIVTIRGRFVGDVGAFQATHDAIASAGAPPMREMGDVAHLPFTGVEDPREFLSLDVWDNDERIEAMYGNPEVTAPFMQLFAAPPTLQVFRCVWLEEHRTEVVSCVGGAARAGAFSSHETARCRRRCRGVPCAESPLHG